MRKGDAGTAYAQALADLAGDPARARAYGEELDSFAGAIASDALLRVFWESPGVARGRKEEALRSALGTGLSPHVLGLLGVLVRKGRERALPQVQGAYRRILDEAEGVARGTLRSAVAPDPAAVGRLAAALGRVAGRSVTFDIRTDPSLLGGAVAQVGDYVADGSLRTRLDALRGRMRQAALEGQGA